MSDLSKLEEVLDQSKGRPIRNYLINGLTSYLMDDMRVRYFQNTRVQQQFITPHSHRYDLACLVIRGEVVNTLWKSSDSQDEVADKFELAEQEYTGEPGKYTLSRNEDSIGYWTHQSRQYGEGEIYHMKSDEIHSIHFSNRAKVLFFEGRSQTQFSKVLLPVVDGETITMPQFAMND